MPTIEQRLQRLENIEAIRRLKQGYARLADEDFDPVGLSNLFTEDATWHSDEMGYHLEGREKIHAFFVPGAEMYPFSLHYMLGEIIDVDDNGIDATGSWYVWVPLTVKGRAAFLAATYDDTYKKVDGSWLIAASNVHLAFFTSYEEGWAKERFLQM